MRCFGTHTRSAYANLRAHLHPPHSHLSPLLTLHTACREYGACARMLQAVAQGARVCVLGQSVTVALFTGKQALSGSRLGGAGVGMPPQPPLTQPFAMPTARQAPEAAPWAGRAVFVGDIPLEATVGSLTKAFEHVGQVETARFCLTYSHALKKGGIIAYR